MLELCVQTGGLGYSDQNPDKTFELIKNAGFSAIDFNIDTHLPGAAIKDGSLTEFFSQSIEDLIDYYRPIKASAEKYGLTFSQMHAPFPLWVRGMDDVNKYMIMVVDKICAVAQFLGCPALVVHPITCASKEEERQINFEMYSAMIPSGKKYKVKLCLENLFTYYKGRVIEGSCADVEEACMYLDTLNAKAGEDVFGFCFDVGHANLLGRNIRDYLKRLGSRLTILHIHDNDSNADMHLMPYTCTRNTGKDFICDWDGFIEGLRDSGYKGTLSFETFRATSIVPAELKADTLAHIAAIGRYFRNRILAE